MGPESEYGKSLEPLSLIQYAQQSGDLSNLQARWEAYKRIPGGDHFLEELLHHMYILSPSTVSDLGTNNASTLVTLRQNGHDGLAVGLDIHTDVFGDPNQLIQDNQDPISLVVGDARQIPISDESVDHVPAHFMLYHVPDPDKALDEIYRILSPGGIVGVATSGGEHKIKHRRFERLIADYLGVEPPDLFNEKFDIEALDKVYKDWLENSTLNISPDLNHISVAHDDPRYMHMYFHQERRVMVFYPDDIDVYLRSLNSMRSAFEAKNPGLIITDKLWNEAVQAVVVPEIEAEIAQRNCFEDKVVRAYLIMVKRDESPATFEDSLQFFQMKEEEVELSKRNIEETVFFASNANFPLSGKDLIDHIVKRNRQSITQWLDHAITIENYSSILALPFSIPFCGTILISMK